MENPQEVEAAVRDRYAAGAAAPEAALCCPVVYEPKYLEVLPEEILEKDYGCGDPSRWVRPGDTVLDLGSGGGKICYIASQIVGPEGRVLGVDVNEEMLGLAERHRAAVAEAIGWDNVRFLKGQIQDLLLDLGKLESWLAEHPVGSLADLRALEATKARLVRDEPLVPDGTVDIVLSNCVLNLVAPEHKEQLFGEMHRVLRRGGRVAISDIVSDEEVPAHLRQDPELWSGCISGAYREDRFLEAFERAGFYGARIEARDERPWRVVEGIEFRSVTVTASKGKEGPCLERKQAVIYRGPWRRVVDDDGHSFVRGQRAAVCDKTFRIMTREDGPYAGEFLPVEPYQDIPLEQAEDFDCGRSATRHPRETKGQDYDVTTEASMPCAPGESCC